MAQTRVYDFGTTLTQWRANALGQTVFTPGVYDGFTPTVIGPTTVEFAPGTFLLPNGVLVSEDSAIQVTVPTPGSATDYTITAEHSNVQSVGGSPVTYVLNTGVLPRSASPNADSLAIAWIRHPGSSALDATMVSAPRPMKAGTVDGNPADLLIPAPFPQACSVVSGSNITVTPSVHSSGNQNLGILVQNSAVSGLQTHQFRLGVPPGICVREVEVFADIPALGSISLSAAGYEVYTESGTLVGVDNASIDGPVIELDYGNTPVGKFVLNAYSSLSDPIVSIGVTITVPPSTSGFFLKGLRLTSD